MATKLPRIRGKEGEEFFLEVNEERVAPEEQKELVYGPMSQKSKTRRKRAKESSEHTTLQQHTRHDKILTPPLATLPKMQPSSWINDWLPEMLWATLVVSGLGRERALDTFKRVGKFIFEMEGDEKPFDITHTGLAGIEGTTLDDILFVITQPEGARACLRPLLLFADLPARERWHKIIDQEPNAEDWNHLAQAVALTLNHQSQEATDCRWLRVLCVVAAGKFVLPNEELAKELLYYPDYGDMRKVRPFIRATEMAFRNLVEEGQNERVWAKGFWTQCFRETDCFPLSVGLQMGELVAGTTVDRVNEVYRLVVDHAYKSASTTATDSRYDTVFGVALYSLSVLKELLRIGTSRFILARLGLRTLLEAYVSLAYLVEKDELELWNTYRVYGAGQTKLSYLKLEEAEKLPAYIDIETLKELANEDI